MTFRFFIYTTSLLRFLFRALDYPRVQSSGKQFLLEYQKEKSGEFSEKLVAEASKRIAIQQLFINDTISRMFGRRTNQFEQESNRLYFILSSVYDDLMDEIGVDLDELDKMVYQPEGYVSFRFYEQALVDTHARLKKRVYLPDDYRRVVDAIHRAQLDSLKQKGGQLSLEELVDVARRKGGGSLLMCRHYIDLPKSPDVDKIWYELGGVIQLSNDLFDVYKDFQEGFDTFVLKANNIDAVKDIYDNQVNRFIAAMQDLKIDEKKKRECFNVLSLIPALGYVALRQVASLSDKEGKLPDFSTFERKQLITDMEKWTNLRYWITSSYRLSKMFTV